MIPKVIHYCWFGSKEIPELESSCIESWTRLLSEYKKYFWNESNLNLTQCKYVEQAYQAKKYAFVSDYCRILALYEFGGIYLDTDVEVLKPFDELLNNNTVLGFENRSMVGTAMIAMEPHSSIAREMLDYYEKTPFYDEYGNENMTTNVTLLNNILQKRGLIPENNLQDLGNGIIIYPREFFFPKKISETEYRITDSSYCVHKMRGSWLTERQKRRGENKIWINICRPLLRCCQTIIITLLGADVTKKVEIRVRNFLK